MQKSKQHEYYLLCNFETFLKCIAIWCEREEKKVAAAAAKKKKANQNKQINMIKHIVDNKIERTIV